MKNPQTVTSFKLIRSLKLRQLWAWIRMDVARYVAQFLIAEPVVELSLQMDVA